MDIKSQLNESQYKAASSDKQFLRIIAGAGTGKTRTLTYRIAYLISNGMVPKRMVAITFTNKAAKEMQTRVDKLLLENDFHADGKPLMVTFHGFCYRFLKKEISHLDGYNINFNIADDSDQGQIYKDIFSHMLKGSSKDFTKAVTSKISDLKTRGLFVNDVTPSEIKLDSIYNYEELLEVYSSYQKYLNSQNLLDFDDLLMLTLKILKQFPNIRRHWQEKYDIFLVDEFQDTNEIQYELVKLLLAPTTRLTVVGDPDQTIYTWRGAKNEIIKDGLQRDFPSLETVVLDQNYRSTQMILNAANALIKNNTDRMEKNLVAANNVEGEKVSYLSCADQDQEAMQIVRNIHNLHMKDNVDYDQFAIIYRSNYLSNALEKQLAKFKIPYDVYGGMKFYERAEIKDALSYLRLIVNPDDLSFRRTLKAPTKSIGDVALQKALSMKDLISDEDTSLMHIFREYSSELHLMKKSVTALERFYSAYDEVRSVYENYEKTSDLMTAIYNYFQKTGFMDYVNQEDRKLEEKISYTAASSVSKVDNVNEFLRSLSSYFDEPQLDDDGNQTSPTLEDFLISVALQSDQDTMKDQKQVALMTGHVSKGLEFPYVFVSGLNQTIFPTNHALQDMKKRAIEEERRLLYVCVTRAQKKLFLSSFGGHNFRNGAPYVPSMFIKELHLFSKEEPAKKDYSAYTGSNRPSSSLYSMMSNNAREILKAGSAMGTPSDEKYEVGDFIVHTSFGKGEVIEVYPDRKILVRFKEGIGTKKLVSGLKCFRKCKEGE
jgi:DNA helicase II / ATP-dependent DNA helicase PcrA